jgi:hypothetical protein
LSQRLAGYQTKRSRPSWLGSALPELVYRQAVATFGQNGAAELIYLVGLYCLVAVTLNGFDVPVPESNWGRKIQTCD